MGVLDRARLRRCGVNIQYPCSCGWARHSLHIVIEKDAQPLTACVTVVTEPDNWRSRILAAWRMLTGHEHTTSEVYLTREQMLGLRNAIAAELDPPQTSADSQWRFIRVNNSYEGGAA